MKYWRIVSTTSWQYVWNICKALDQLGNVILGGHPDETISVRVGKKVENNEAGKISLATYKILNWLDPNHCEKSIKIYEERRQITQAK